MSSQGHSSDGCSDSEDFESPEGDNSQSDPDQPRREETHSNLSTIWGFEGTMQMDLNPDEWDHSDMPDKDDLVAHFATEYYKKPPVPIIHMEIGIEFSKAIRGGILDRTFTAPIGGFIQAKSAGADCWSSWLHGGGAVGLKLSPYTQAELHGKQRDRSSYKGWTLVARCGRRRQFQMLGKAWKFSATIAADRPSSPTCSPRLLVRLGL